jgi:hypothetical protein
VRFITGWRFFETTPFRKKGLFEQLPFGNFPFPKGHLLTSPPPARYSLENLQWEIHNDNHVLSCALSQFLGNITSWYSSRFYLLIPAAQQDAFYSDFRANLNV